MHLQILYYSDFSPLIFKWRVKLDAGNIPGKEHWYSVFQKIENQWTFVSSQLQYFNLSIQYQLLPIHTAHYKTAVYIEQVRCSIFAMKLLNKQNFWIHKQLLDFQKRWIYKDVFLARKHFDHSVFSFALTIFKTAN